MNLISALASGLHPFTRRSKHIGVRLRRGLAGLWHWTWHKAGGLLRGTDRLAQSVIRGAIRFAGERLAPITVVVLTAAVILSVCNWDWLQAGVAGPESGSTTIRNLSFLFAGLIGLPLAIWRSLVSERQADAAQRQANTALQNLLNERYQQGAEMLGSDVLAVRLGGIYTLERLAEEHPELYHIQNIRLLCAFVRHPSGAQGEQGEQPTGETNLVDMDPERDPKDLVREDVQAILRAIGDRSESRRSLEKAANFRLYLQNVNLSGSHLDDADLSQAQLAGAKLRRAVAYNVNLAGANLFKADISFAQMVRADLRSAAIANSMMVRIDLQEADLSSTNLFHADLTDADLRGAKFTSTLLIGTNLTGVKLQGTNLSAASFRGLEMSGADLSQSSLLGTHFHASNLSGVNLSGADLTRAFLFGVDLTDANLENANLSGTDFEKPSYGSPPLFESDRRPELRLTQAQLDSASADPNNPPKLEGMVDAQTGEPLVWRGRPRPDHA